MDVVGVFEALRLADLDVPLLSLRKQEVVTAALGLKVIPDGRLNPAVPPDLLVVPGGGWLARAAKGAWAESENGEILSTLKSLHKSGAVLASVCTGALLLAKANLLDGRPATTNRQAFAELMAEGAQVVEARVMDDQDIITAGGITASLDLGLWLIERFISTEKALAVAAKLEFELRGPVWQRDSRRSKNS